MRELGYLLQIDLKSEIRDQSILYKPRNLFLGRRHARNILGKMLSQDESSSGRLEFGAS